MGSSFADAASPSQSLLQCVLERLAHRNIYFTKPDDTIVQREKLVIALEALLNYMHAQHISALPDFNASRTAASAFIKNKDAGRSEMSIFLAHAVKLKAKINASCVALPSSADTVRVQNCYEVLLKSLTAQKQGLQSQYINIVIPSQGSQAYTRDRVSSSLKDFCFPVLARTSQLADDNNYFQICFAVVSPKAASDKCSRKFQNNPLLGFYRAHCSFLYTSFLVPDLSSLPLLKIYHHLEDQNSVVTVGH